MATEKEPWVWVSLLGEISLSSSALRSGSERGGNSLVGKGWQSWIRFYLSCFLESTHSKGVRKSGVRRHKAFPPGPSPCGNGFGFSFPIKPNCSGFRGKEQLWDMVQLEFPNGQERERHQECEPVSVHGLWDPPVFLSVVSFVYVLCTFLKGCFFLTQGKMQNCEVCQCIFT